MKEKGMYNDKCPLWGSGQYQIKDKTEYLYGKTDRITAAPKAAARTYVNGFSGTYIE